MVKLVLPEAESEALGARLAGERLLACGVVLTELPRAVARRIDTPAARRAVSDVLDRLAFLDVDPSLLRAAVTLPPVELRSLAALHLAAAMRVRDLMDAFVVYDRQLVQAARAAGLAVESPGAA